MELELHMTNDAPAEGAQAAPKQAPKIKIKPMGLPGGITRLPTPGMCYYHQQILATFICARCGRAICNNCAVLYGNITFCPQCSPFGPGVRPVPGVPRAEFSPLVITTFVLGLLGSILILTGLAVEWWSNPTAYRQPTSSSGFSLMAAGAAELATVLVGAIIILIFSILATAMRTYPILLTSGMILIVFGVLSFVFPLVVVVRLNLLGQGLLGMGAFVCTAGGILSFICGITCLLASLSAKAQYRPFYARQVGYGAY